MGIKVVRRKPKTAGKTISDADRRRKKKPKMAGNPISDADRSLAEKFLNRNDGGVASKTRRF